MVQDNNKWHKWLKTYLTIIYHRLCCLEFYERNKQHVDFMHHNSIEKQNDFIIYPSALWAFNFNLISAFYAFLAWPVRRWQGPSGEALVGSAILRAIIIMYIYSFSYETKQYIKNKWAWFFLKKCPSTTSVSCTHTLPVACFTYLHTVWQSGKGWWHCWWDLCKYIIV